MQDRKRRRDKQAAAAAATKRHRSTPPSRATRRESHRHAHVRASNVRERLPCVDADGFYTTDASKRGLETREERTDAFVRAWLDSLRARARGAPSPCELAVFSRQKEAFACADASHLPMRVFSRQCEVSGRRTFMAATLDAFWSHYQACRHDRRHHYEIIRQNRPCHLYLDLEYPTWDDATKVAINQEMDGNERVNGLLKLLRTGMERRFHCTFDKEDVVELESSKQGKFSRHVLVKVKGKAFQDAMHVGAFVKGVLGEAYADPERDIHRMLFVKDGHGATNSSKRMNTIVDTAVYTRNRAFRLMWSYKHGKKERLMPIFRLAPQTTKSDKNLFFSTLASEVDTGSELLSCDDVEQHAPGRRAITKDGSGSANQHGHVLQNSGEPSPHEIIDSFVLSVASHGGIPARIRSWIHFPDMEMVLYSMSNNRYCRRIRRPHKSNNVMYIADLKLGVVYQKCLDPECRDWKSESIFIPPEIMNRYNFDRSEAECDDKFWEDAFRQCEHLLQSASASTLNNPEACT